MATAWRAGRRARQRPRWAARTVWFTLRRRVGLYMGALEALGNPARRAIFELLVGRPQPVRDLADALPVSRPAVSQHLKALKQSGLVIDRAEGTRIYRVDPAGVAAMRAYLEQMWDTALATFAVAVENQEANTKRTRLMITSSLERA